jgi:hypothetical protein
MSSCVGKDAFALGSVSISFKTLGTEQRLVLLAMTNGNALSSPTLLGAV